MVKCKLCKKETKNKKFCSRKCSVIHRNNTQGVWNQDKNHPKYKAYIAKMKDRKGSKNPHFKGGWDSLRAEIIREGGNKICDICGTEQNIELHHMDFNRDNNVKENIKPLCKSCHTKVHNKIKNITGDKTDRS